MCIVHTHFISLLEAIGDTQLHAVRTIKCCEAKCVSMGLWDSGCCTHAHTRTHTEQMCGVSPPQGKCTVYTLSKSSTDLHTSCAASKTQLWVFFCMCHTELTAEAQHVVVHFVSVAFKKLCCHIKHTFKRLHLPKRNTYELKHVNGHRCGYIDGYEHKYVHKHGYVDDPVHSFVHENVHWCALVLICKERLFAYAQTFAIICVLICTWACVYVHEYVIMYRYTFIYLCINCA